MNETTADESTPVTRHRSITRNRGGAASHPVADLLQQAVRRSEEDEAGDPQDLDPVGEPPGARRAPEAGRSTLTW